MARIRSTHPEQWSDDQFVSCSPLARLLALVACTYDTSCGRGIDAIEILP